MDKTWQPEMLRLILWYSLLQLQVILHLRILNLQWFTFIAVTGNCRQKTGSLAHLTLPFIIRQQLKGFSVSVHCALKQNKCNARYYCHGGAKKGHLVTVKLRCFISHTFRYHSPSYYSRQFLFYLTCVYEFRHFKSPLTHTVIRIHLISLSYHILVFCHLILVLWSKCWC